MESVVINGITVMQNQFVNRPKYIQVAFPKSKKKRIRAKWAKRKVNFGYREEDVAIYVKSENTIFVSTCLFEKIKKKSILY
jgi:hypothetical protein